jgi:ribA/ribD-fused uncharacterized protein
MGPIRFYKINEEYGDFSNFAVYRIFVDGASWPTSEHYFQASKFHDSGIKEKIRRIDSPMRAAEEGRNRNNPLRDDWEDVKIEIMKKAIVSKFLQHHNLKITLIKTHDRQIIEHSSNDSYWADGGDGKGKNMLGVLLMELRSEVLNKYRHPEWFLPPWLAFPNISAQDMFWRMGLGEDYMYQWVTWFNSQSPDIQIRYQDTFLPVDDWHDFYAE